MPEYTFFCENKDCMEYFVVVKHMKEFEPPYPCPKCGSTEKVFRDYSADNVYGAYVPNLSECTTVGQYAEKQTKKYGKEKCQKMLESFKTVKEPFPEHKLGDGMSVIRKYEDVPRGPRRLPPKRSG